MTHQEILRDIEAIAREYLDRPCELRSEMSLRGELEFDSLQWLTLVIEVENRFRIYLEDEDESAIRSVGDLVETVHRKLHAEAAARG